MADDYHTHTHYSLDSNTTIEAVCEAALKRGLGGVAITDHLDLDPQDRFLSIPDFSRQLEEIRTVQDRYGDRLKVLWGVEVSYQLHLEEQIRSVLAGFDFDLVLGAVHRADGHDYSYEPDMESLAAYGSPGAACAPYLRELKSAAGSGMFDIIAHLDLPKRMGWQLWGRWPDELFLAEYEPILAALIESGTAIEINTSGIDQFPGQQFPGPSLLQCYRELGGKLVSYGSDAHQPGHVGRYLELAERLIEVFDLTPVQFGSAGRQVR